jgi:WD40 repeat protein
LVLWNLERRQELGRLAVPTHEHAYAEFSPDGGMLAVAGLASSPFFKLFDMTTQRKIMDLPHVGMFAFSENGKVVVMEDDPQQTIVRWYDTADRQGHDMGSDVCGGNYGVPLLARSPSGKILAVRSTSLVNDFAPATWTWLPARFRHRHIRSQVTLFDFLTRQRIQTLPGVHQAGEVRFSPDARMFAIATDDGAMTVWPVPPRKPLWLAASLAAAFVAVAWALRLAYRRFRRRGASAVADKGPLPA